MPPQRKDAPDGERTPGGTGGVTRQPHLRARCCPGWPPCVCGPARPSTFRQPVEAAPHGPARPPATLRLGKKSRPRTAPAAKRLSNCPKIRHLRCAHGALVPRGSWPPAASARFDAWETLHPQRPWSARYPAFTFGQKKEIPLSTLQGPGRSLEQRWAPRRTVKTPHPPLRGLKAL
jgi:hypothetical protein